MAKTVSNVLDTLLTNLRASGGVAYDNTTFLIPVLSRVQRTLNARLRRVLSTGLLTTTANTLIYTIREHFQDAIDIISIVDNERTLHKIPDWKELVSYDLEWLERTGPRFESFAQIGRDLLVIYPTLVPAGEGLTVNVTYSKLTDELTNEADFFELYDEDISLVILMAELVCLIHQRLFIEFQQKLPFFTESLKNHLLVIK